MRKHVGMIDLTPFTKHEVTGPGAEALARRPGGQQGADQDRTHRAVPCAHARAAASARNSPSPRSPIEHFYVVSAGAAERYDSDYLQQHAAARRRASSCATSP